MNYSWKKTAITLSLAMTPLLLASRSYSQFEPNPNIPAVEAKSNIKADEANLLLGKWQLFEMIADGELISLEDESEDISPEELEEFYLEFTQDGKVIRFGEVAPYRVEGNKIIVSTNDNTTDEAEFSVSKTELTISMENELESLVMKFKRVE